MNSLSAQQRVTAKKHLENANTDIADKAAEALVGVPDHYRTPRKTMGSDAARTLHDHEYQRVQIHRTRDGIVVLTFPRHGTPRALEHGHDIGAAMKETGIGEYLDANGTVSSYEVEKALSKLARGGETRLVLDTGDSDPTERMQATVRKERPAVVREADRAVGGSKRSEKKSLDSKRESNGCYKP